MKKPSYEESEKRIKELEYVESEHKQAEDALRKSEIRYKHLLHAITSYVYTVTIENGEPVKTFHGPRCTNVTGYTPGEFEADPFLWINMVHEEDSDAVKNQAAQMLPGEGAPPLEHRIIRKDGKLRWVRNTPVPQYDDREKLIAYDGVIKDVTERKKAEEKIVKQNQFLEDILESLTHPFYVVNDKDYTIEIANSAAKVIGITETSTCYNVTHKSDIPCQSDEHTCPLEFIRKTKKPVTAEHIHYDKDGNARDIEVNAYPIFDNEGHVKQIIEYTVDITERKQMEEAL